MAITDIKSIKLFTLLFIKILLTFLFCLLRLNYIGLFGWNLVKPSDTEVVLTAGEFDAMAVYQETGLLAVSLPQADSVLPQKVHRIFFSVSAVATCLPLEFTDKPYKKYY